MFDRGSAPEVADREDLGARLAELALRIDRCKAQFLAILAEFDRLEAWRDWGSKSCADWLAWRCGLSPSTAREQVRVARALVRLPGLSAALNDGRLSYAKVRALTRMAAGADEATLVALGEAATAAELDELAHRYKLSRSAADADHRHRQRSVHYYFDDDGCLVLIARLEPEQGVTVIRAIEAAVAELEDERASDASAEAPTDDDLEGAPPWERTRADALVWVADRALTGKASASDADRALIVVHVGLGSLPSEPPRLQEGPLLERETARRLACDASVMSVSHAHPADAGEPGRRSRVVQPRLRRRLMDRDRRCRFPSCRARRRLHAHHIMHWADGGPTTFENLVLLCPHHHRAVHEGRFSISKQPDAYPIFVRPDGSAIERPSAPLAPTG